MATFMFQGRYMQSAMAAMVKKPEDRTIVVIISGTKLSAVFGLPLGVRCQGRDLI